MNKVPSLRFKEFSGEWEEKIFKDIFKINQGLQIAISERFLEPAENRMFYITNEFLKENSKVKYYIENPPTNVVCNENDILMTRTGNTGEVVTDINGAFHNNFFKIAYDKNVFDKRFICYILKSSKIQNMILKLAGSSTIPDLNHSDFYKIKNVFPNLQEQQKISNFLSSVDKKISIVEEKLNLFNQYKKGIMQKIFSQELRFKDENGNNYPEWEEKKLNDLTESISNGISLNQNFDGIGYKVTRIETISSGKINLEKVGYIITDKNIEEYKLNIGNLLFSNINSVEHIGKIAYVDKNYDLYHGMNLLRIVFNKNLCSKYFYYVLTERKYKKLFEKLCNKAVSQASINQTELGKIKVYLPCLEEQKKIADFLSAIDNKIENISGNLESLKLFKKSMLQKMFV